jgi:uncharacterized protein YhbP (UPF0306 family)
MNKYINIKKLARKIMESNQYMSLGTVNEEGVAWVSPVVYAYDNRFCLYFMSLPKSRHGENIRNNSRISTAIYDSHQNFGEGVGLQIEGEVKLVPVWETAKAFKCYFARKWPYGCLTNVTDFKRFYKVYKYRFYKIRPTQVWMNDPRKESDMRVKVRGLYT